MISLLAVLLALQGGPADAPVKVPAPNSGEARPDAEITVTGTRLEKRLIVGSRLPRVIQPDPRGFVSQIASDTGVAGMTPQSGMDPFAGGTRNILVKSCRGSDPRMTKAVLCDLALAQKGIGAGNLGSARAAIDRALSNPDSTPADRFFAQRFAFQIAVLENDQAARGEALHGMLQSGLLSLQDRVLTRKTLASLAMARRDDRAAIEQLEALLAEAPSEVNAQANLGVLYDRAGQPELARQRIEAAVRLTAASGKEVPKAWADYLRRTP